MSHHQGNWLRLINNLLSGAVLLLACYIILLPFFPSIQFWVAKHTHHYPALVKVNSNPSPIPAPNENIPAENTLVIPSMGLQTTIYDGPTATTLNKGVWHRPNTSDPTQASNTVLVGHRFTYTNPQGIFYHLDVVAVGDPIVVYWHSEKYVYKVTRVFVVHPDAVQIEAPTDNPLLTLYTCTPLWSAHDRLVVQAELQEQ